MPHQQPTFCNPSNLLENIYKNKNRLQQGYRLNERFGSEIFGKLMFLDKLGRLGLMFLTAFNAFVVLADNPPWRYWNKNISYYIYI